MHIMHDKGIIITGTSGYLGSSFIKKFNKDNVFKCTRNTFNTSKPKFFDLYNREVNNLSKACNSFTILHLATYFSKDPEDKNKIKSANLDFGKKLLDYSKNLNIEKIIYTNSMFNFYEDPKVRKLYYTSSKMEFSYILNQYCNENKIYLDEIYLDNTFGGVDLRKKVLPSIVQNIINFEDSPVINKKNTINLIYFKDVLNRFDKSINSNFSGSTSFINKQSVNLETIFNFLKLYRDTKTLDKSILKYSKNNYLISSPKNNHMKLKLSNLENKLIEYLNYYLNHKI